MRVRAVALIFRDFIADHAARVACDPCELDAHEGDQVSVNRRPIAGGIIAQDLDDLGMGEWALGFRENAEHRETRRGHPQTELPDARLDIDGD